MLVVDRPGYYVDFVSRPLFQAFMREGLGYHYFHLPHVDLTRLSYLPRAMSLKNKMLKQNRLKFLRWRWVNRRRFNIYGSEVKYKSKMEKEAIYYDKFITRRSEQYFG